MSLLTYFETHIQPLVDDIERLEAMTDQEYLESLKEA